MRVHWHTGIGSGHDLSLGGSNLDKGRIIRVKVTKEERKQRVMKTKQKKRKRVK